MRSICHYRSFILFAFCFLIVTACTQQKRLYFVGPDVIDNVKPPMEQPGFWISQHSSPDGIILGDEAIGRLNTQINDELALVRDVTSYPIIQDGIALKNELAERLDRIRSKPAYLADDSPASESWFAHIEENMRLASMPGKLPVSFALAVRFTSQRRLPTEEPLFSETGSSYFDRLQNNGLDIGTPMAVVYTTGDGRWLYGICSDSAGWVKAEDVALCSRKELDEFVKSDSFVVLINAKCDIFSDRRPRLFRGTARMGSRFPLISQVCKGYIEIGLPVRDNSGKLLLVSGFIQKKDVHVGYLPYTPRTIISQAFLLLHEPYGWGGKNIRQDCSRFIKQIFATVGIILPRNSRAQAKVGRMVREFSRDLINREKTAILQEHLTGGVALLFIPGHVMLFLGRVDERFYVIHSTWGYRQKRLFGDQLRLLNRVVVSDLSLGKGTKRGSLLKRLVSATHLSN